MTLFFSEFSFIFIFLLFSIFLPVFILLLSFVFIPLSTYAEKLSAYECGFDPFEDARGQFEVRFYIVAILFLIFDLEASFMFPWALSLRDINNFGFWIMFDFIFELVVGYVYVWKVGALEWE